jgi:hypothetical protein
MWMLQLMILQLLLLQLLQQLLASHLANSREHKSHTTLVQLHRKQELLPQL